MQISMGIWKQTISKFDLAEQHLCACCFYYVCGHVFLIACFRQRFSYVCGLGFFLVLVWFEIGSFDVLVWGYMWEGLFYFFSLTEPCYGLWHVTAFQIQNFWESDSNPFETLPIGWFQKYLMQRYVCNILLSEYVEYIDNVGRLLFGIDLWV